MILVHSPKGGVGTTTIAANLALMLAHKRMQVTAADTTGQGMLGLCLGGAPGKASHGSSGQGRTVVLSGVRLLRVDRNRPAVSVAADLAAHDEPGHLLIVDVPAGDQDLFRLLAARAEVRLCVLTPEPATLAVLPLAVGEDLSTTDLPYFILNRVDERLRLERDISSLLRGLLGEQLIGVVRRDESVREAAGMMEALDRYAPESAALADLRSLTDRVAEIILPMAARGVA